MFGNFGLVLEILRISTTMYGGRQGNNVVRFIESGKYLDFIGYSRGGKREVDFFFLDLVSYEPKKLTF